MKLFKYFVLSLLVLNPLFGATVETLNLNQRVDHSEGVFIGAVEHFVYRQADGLIYTEAVLRVKEGLKGQFLENVKVRQPGGIYKGVALDDSLRPAFRNWNNAVFFVEISEGYAKLVERPDAVIDLNRSGSDADLNSIRRHLERAPREGADFTQFVTYRSKQLDVTSTGLLGDTNSRRFIAPDRGDPIPVDYDASVLPNGISKEQARQALEAGLAAWAESASLEFVILGERNYSNSPAEVNFDDEAIHILLGDKFDTVSPGDTSGTTLGVGGQWRSNESELGGQVGDITFAKSLSGYLTLEHTKESMEDLVTYTEVLTHEIGHTLGLAHSSEDSNESDELLKDATMFFNTAEDNRGATLKEWDKDTVVKAYPLDNLPPYVFDREITIVSGPNEFGNDQANVFELAGGDLFGDTLTLEIVSQEGVLGSFDTNTAGPTISYDPGGYFNDGSANEGSFFQRLFYRYSDGVNKSALAQLRVTRIRTDSHPQEAPDGLPDAWMETYFGQKEAGENMGPDEDFDSDGITNYGEFRAGTDPTDNDSLLVADSSLAQANGNLENTIHFEAIPGKLYWLERSLDLQAWDRVELVTAPEDGNQLSITREGASAEGYFRISLVE